MARLYNPQLSKLLTIIYYFYQALAPNGAAQGKLLSIIC